MGEILYLLTLVIAISKCLTERISKENGVSLEKIEDIVNKSMILNIWQLRGEKKIRNDNKF